jgi:anti-sigma B factor antagonist
MEGRVAAWEPAFRLVSAVDGPTRLLGDLDVASAPAVREWLAEIDGDVELDCSGITFIDCSGLTVLADGQRGCQAAGVRMCLIAPSRCVIRLLDLAGLNGFFDIRGSVDS